MAATLPMRGVLGRLGILDELEKKKAGQQQPEPMKPLVMPEWQAPDTSYLAAVMGGAPQSPVAGLRFNQGFNPGPLTQSLPSSEPGVAAGPIVASSGKGANK